MNSAHSDDDDRTVIRPPGGDSAASAPAPAAAAAAGGAGESATVGGPVREQAPPQQQRGSAGAGLRIGTRLGEFEILDLIGEGGFGVVYTAMDHSLQRRVALKEYMPSALAMRSGETEVRVKSERHRDTFEAGLKSFINEARLLASFDHPSLVKVYRFWEANGTAYMVMPLYEGITLKDHLKSLPAPPDETQLLELLDPLTRALMVIHAEQCFHRDIAPDNVILLAGSGTPLLLDFGAARRVIGDMTQALTVILKPGYAPIEQYAEAPGMKQGAWTDVYALAAMVYFAIMGKTPPPSVSRLVNDQYQPLTAAAAGRYSQAFLQAIDQALIVAPDARTQSVAELRAQLGLADAATPSGSASGVTLVRTTPAPAAVATAGAGRSGASGASAASGGSGSSAPRRPGWLWPALAATVLVLGGGAYWALRPRPGGTTAPAAQPSLAAAPATQPAARPPAAQVAQTPAVRQAAAPQVAAAQPQQPAAPPPLRVRAEFQRLLDSQSPGWSVQADAVAPRLRINRDYLRFRVHSSRAGYVTVLVYGPDGSLTELVPSQSMPSVRIAAGQTLTLPPADIRIQAAAPTGPERFMVLVSRAPRSYAAYSPDVEGGYPVLPTGSAAAAAAAQVRSTGLPALLGTASDCHGGACNAFGASGFTVDVVH